MLRIRWIIKRRNEESRSVRALLVNVVDDLWKPLFPEQARDELGLFQVQHEPVAIVIVTGVVMIELGRFCSFVRRAQRLAIPVCDDVDAIGIGRRNQQQDCVLEDLASLGILCSRQLIRELHRHLRSDDLSRVNRTGDRYDNFAVCDQLIALNGLRDLARICELLLNLFVFGQSQYILSRADNRYDQWSLQRRLAQRLNYDTIGSTVQSFEVVSDLRPVCYGAIVSGRESEN